MALTYELTSCFLVPLATSHKLFPWPTNIRIRYCREMKPTAPNESLWFPCIPSSHFWKFWGQPQSRSNPNHENSLGLQHMSCDLRVVPGAYFYNLQFCFRDRGLKLVDGLRWNESASLSWNPETGGRASGAPNRYDNLSAYSSSLKPCCQSERGRGHQWSFDDAY